MSSQKLMFLLAVYSFTSISCKDNISCSEVTGDRYRYNPIAGRCTNCNGQVGYNELDLEYIQETKNAECVDLSNTVLITLLEGKTRFDLGYDSLYKYNFRGAKFDSASLHFNHIRNSDLRGADMALLFYGYATIEGEIDDHTILPPSGCETEENSLICWN